MRPAAGTPTYSAGSLRPTPGRLQLLIGAQRRRREIAHGELELQALRRHQRTLCEDLDELLGRLADAVRREHPTAAARLLHGAAAVATELARSLPRPEGGRSVAGPSLLVEAPDEAQVQRAHRLLEELDAELDRTARGNADAGAPALAGCLRRVVDSLRGRDQQQ